MFVPTLFCRRATLRKRDRDRDSQLRPQPRLNSQPQGAAKIVTQQWPRLIIPKKGTDSHLAHKPVYKPHVGPRSVVNFSVLPTEWLIA